MRHFKIGIASARACELANIDKRLIGSGDTLKPGPNAKYPFVALLIGYSFTISYAEQADVFRFRMAARNSGLAHGMRFYVYKRKSKLTLECVRVR